MKNDLVCSHTAVIVGAIKHQELSSCFSFLSYSCWTFCSIILHLSLNKIHLYLMRKIILLTCFIRRDCMKTKKKTVLLNAEVCVCVCTASFSSECKHVMRNTDNIVVLGNQMCDCAIRLITARVRLFTCFYFPFSSIMSFSVRRGERVVSFCVPKSM